MRTIGHAYILTAIFVLGLAITAGKTAIISSLIFVIPLVGIGLYCVLTDKPYNPPLNKSLPNPPKILTIPTIKQKL